MTLFWGSCQTGVSAVVLIPFSEVKIKNQYKLLLAWIITFEFSINNRQSTTEIFAS